MAEGPDHTVHRDVVDFDLHGYVGIRLLDARPSDVAAVTRQLGPLQAPLDRDPDITVRFVDELTISGPVTFAGLHVAGFDDRAFYLLRGRDRLAARVQIPFEDVGGRCDIVCERQHDVPLLLAIVNMTALAKGLLPLHASAFVHDGIGVLATGWAKGGKTETLLAMAGRGARYVGDEWVYISRDRHMYGIPEPIRLWYWQLRQLPAVRRRLSRRRRTRLGLLHVAARSVESLAPPAGRGSGASVLRRLAPVLRRQVYAKVPPVRLFGAAQVALHAPLDHVLLVASHDDDHVTVEPVDGTDVARRMLASLQDERAVFMSYYRQFRYAFPDRRSPVVEQVCDLEAELATAVLEGLPCTWLRHPYPIEIARLVTPIEQIVGARTRPAAVPHRLTRTGGK